MKRRRGAETGPEKRRGEIKAPARAKRAGTTKIGKKHKKTRDGNTARYTVDGRGSRF